MHIDQEGSYRQSPLVRNSLPASEKEIRARLQGSGSPQVLLSKSKLEMRWVLGVHSHRLVAGVGGVIPLLAVIICLHRDRTVQLLGLSSPCLISPHPWEPGRVGLQRGKDSER